ncbi:hypothetical protein KY284_012882 [Solanum tuberosum]|nr:hypothetical protein KY284_012882 [Solanum tuberosum]
MRVASEIHQERGEIATVSYEALLFDFGIRPPTGLSRSCLLFIIIAGLIHADKNNFTPFMPFGPCGVFKSSVVLFFAYIGFDVVSTMAEKTKNPGKDIPIGLVGSILLTTALYCARASVLCIMQPYKIIDINAPF